MNEFAQPQVSMHIEKYNDSLLGRFQKQFHKITTLLVRQATRMSVEHHLTKFTFPYCLLQQVSN